VLNKALIEDVLSAALSTGGDFAEVFVEDKRNTVITMIGGKVEDSIAGRDFGVGVRIFNGFNSVYAYTNEHDRDRLIALARQAAASLSGQRRDLTLSFMASGSENRHPIRLYPGDVEPARKVGVMREASRYARDYSPEVSQVSARYVDEDQSMLVANTEGTFAEDRRVRSRMSIEAVASNGREMQTGFYGPGAQKGFEFFEGLDLKFYAEEAARTAVTMLHAGECPSGRFPVILDNEFGGVLLHEACGHGLEATSVAKKTSVFADKLGEKISSDVVTYIDDGTLPNEWGSLNIDDEGMPTRRNVLIENGILTSYMIDKLNGRRMGMAPTGNSRRQSYKFAPTSRMTNTFIAPGTSAPEEIIGSVEFGIYARYLGGGQVNPATGDFNFGVREAYIVRNGKICEPVRGASLIGTGADALRRIDMVSHNLAHGQGMCGSLSGSIPVNCGQPMIRISELTVGGRKEK